MKFRTWIETEFGNEAAPQPVNRGSSTPASNGVHRTGLQPQVGAEEIHTKQKDEQDKLQAIDAAMQRCDSEMPQGKDDSPKVNKFKELWDKLKIRWEDIKMEKETPEDPEDDGLGDASGGQKFIQMMQQHPNMAPAGPDQHPSGTGIFGTLS